MNHMFYYKCVSQRIFFWIRYFSRDKLINNISSYINVFFYLAILRYVHVVSHVFEILLSIILHLLEQIVFLFLYHPIMHLISYGKLVLLHLLYH
jgi:hypothetical protein